MMPPTLLGIVPETTSTQDQQRGDSDLASPKGAPPLRHPDPAAPLNRAARFPAATISPAMARWLCWSSPASSPGG